MYRNKVYYTTAYYIEYNKTYELGNTDHVSSSSIGLFSKQGNGNKDRSLSSSSPMHW